MLCWAGSLTPRMALALWPVTPPVTPEPTAASCHPSLAAVLGSQEAAMGGLGGGAVQLLLLLGAPRPPPPGHACRPGSEAELPRPPAPVTWVSALPAGLERDSLDPVHPAPTTGPCVSPVIGGPSAGSPTTRSCRSLASPWQPLRPPPDAAPARGGGPGQPPSNSPALRRPPRPRPRPLLLPGLHRPGGLAGLRPPPAGVAPSLRRGLCRPPPPLWAGAGLRGLGWAEPHPGTPASEAGPS